MRTTLWVVCVILVGLLSSLAGYNSSVKSGVEPGFFEAVETGSYGAGTGDGDGGAEGMDTEAQEHYKKLLTE